MKLLFVIDMQNDFIDGVLGSPEAQAIVPKVIEKIKQQKGDDRETVRSDHLPCCAPEKIERIHVPER